MSTLNHEIIPGYKPPHERVCTYCGCVMQPKIVWQRLPPEAEEDENVVRRHGVPHKAVRILHYGYSIDGLFCTLTCGYQFACWKIREDK